MHAIAGYAVFCFLSWMIYCDRRRFFDAWRSRQWKPVKALVTDIQDEEFELDAVDPHSGGYVARHTTRFYTFRYAVEGVTYESKRYSYEGDLRGSQPSLEVTGDVTIYYNPAAPQQSVVRRGFTWVMLTVPIAAVCSLAWALGHSVLR
ncbi:MAG: DUF3592 domain-containing protein [Verrucomicrobiaceae bacterium]